MLTRILTSACIICILLVISENIVLAQNCSSVTVTAPAQINVGENITFTANVTLNGQTPTYNWSVSAGEILSGQGTPTIQVRTTNDTSGRNISATVQLGNLGTVDPKCTSSATATVGVTSLPSFSMVAQFTQTGNAAKQRLDDLVAETNNDPTSRIGLIAFSSESGTVIEAERRLSFAYSYLINNKGVDPNRIVIINGGKADVAKTQVAIIPEGATFGDENNPSMVLRPSLKVIVQKRIGSQWKPIKNASVTVKLNGTEIKNGTTDEQGISLITLDVRGNHTVVACEGTRCSNEKLININNNVQFITTPALRIP